jgi:hypothetical protein
LQGQLVKSQAQPQAHGLFPLQSPANSAGSSPIVSLILYIYTVLVTGAHLSSV